MEKSSLTEVMTDTNKTMSCFLDNSEQSLSVLASLENKVSQGNPDMEEVLPLLKSMRTDISSLSTNVVAILEMVKSLAEIVQTEATLNKTWRPQLSNEVMGLQSVLGAEHKRFVMYISGS